MERKDILFFTRVALDVSGPSQPTFVDCTAAHQGCVPTQNTIKAWSKHTGKHRSRHRSTQALPHLEGTVGSLRLARKPPLTGYECRFGKGQILQYPSKRLYGSKQTSNERYSAQSQRQSGMSSTNGKMEQKKTNIGATRSVTDLPYTVKV